MESIPNREDWEIEFSNSISSYEANDNFNLLSACRAKYGDVALEDFLDHIKDFIRNLLQNRDDALVAEVEKLHEYDSDPYWIGFNDGIDKIGKVISLIKKEK